MRLKKEHATEEHGQMTPFPAVFVALVVILEIKHRALCVPENKETIYLKCIILKREENTRHQGHDPGFWTGRALVCLCGK